jgi:MoxR-like ATPase|tara:strand:- start:577 stop:1428 length:852 start_codon:yes stop_codon:yes gene_type:complete
MKDSNKVSKAQLEKVGYFASDYIIDALNSSLILNKPLLIEGPAGSGKTWLAKALSEIKKWPLVRLQSHEGIDEDKALYEWNYRKQLLSLQSENDEEMEISDIFSEEYLIERPILKALRSPNPSVLLIDEVDRADEEMEALLLEVLAENQVTIPELGTITSNGNFFTILTSNSTRELSDALKRRCIYLYLDFPEIEREARILSNHISGISNEDSLKYASLISFVRKLNIQKPPSVAEVIDWLKYSFLNNDKFEESYRKNIGILIKNKNDQEVVIREIENFENQS